MKFLLDGLQVYFPYANIYPEQLAYMRQLKKALDAKGHAVLEMPSGTGKTITLLSLLTSYLFYCQAQVRKIIYCTRTVEEMEKVMQEARILYQCLQEESSSVTTFLCIGLASRKHLCLNEQVVQVTEGYIVDGRCRSLTASWIREKAKADFTIPTCPFFENLLQQESEDYLPSGVYSLQDLRNIGQQRGWCPYFYSRKMLTFANLIVYSYHYLLDPKVSQLVSGELTKDAIVVFDEAHNIDNVCIEALSVVLNRNMIDDANSASLQLANRVARAKGKNWECLQKEYENLAKGINGQSSLEHNAQISSFEETLGCTTPSFSSIQETLEEAVPSSIRKAEYFIVYLQSLLAYLKKLILQTQALEISNAQFVRDFSNECAIEVRSFRFTSDRLSSLLRTLEIGDWSRFHALSRVAEMITIASTYSKGFSIILEPYDTKTNSYAPVLQLACLDASLAMIPVTRKFRSVVITSGTLSPLDFYPRMLDFGTAVSASFNMSFNRRCVLPLIIGFGPNKLPLTSKFNQRGEMDVPKSYGKMLLEIAKVVPDGVVGFFPSYEYMELVLGIWKETNLLDELQQVKLVFIETNDAKESSIALKNFRKACDIGRGAMFLSVARGKAAEGIDFDHHYGRCVVLFGMPFQYTESKELKARLRYLRERFQIMENDFLVFDAMRQAAQCAGRVIRNKYDYGIMVFADRRYSRYDKLTKLPRWILQFLHEHQISIDVDTAVTKIKLFLLEMSQQMLLK
eukprot:jgi/Galph1/1883/GphlegSOOS_G581.1